MKITLPRLSSQKGSSISVKISVELEDKESLAGCKASCYIKAKMSDTKIICILDAQVLVDDKAILISVSPPRSDNIPAGQFIYYLELTKAPSVKIVERNYLNVEP